MQQNNILISDYQPNQRYLRASLIGTRTEWHFSGNTHMRQISIDLIPEYLNRDVLKPHNLQKNDPLISDYQPNQRYLRASLFNFNPLPL